MGVGFLIVEGLEVMLDLGLGFGFSSFFLVGREMVVLRCSVL